jgi:hypothetical protein
MRLAIIVWDIAEPARKRTEPTSGVFRSPRVRIRWHCCARRLRSTAGTSWLASGASMTELGTAAETDANGPLDQC